MSPAKYILVHSGMPAPDPSSNPADLTSISNIEKYLAGTPFASRSISLLSNPMSYSYRIHLLVPFEGSEWVVLKAVRPYTRNVPELALPLGREVSNKQDNFFSTLQRLILCRCSKWKL